MEKFIAYILLGIVVGIIFYTLNLPENKHKPHQEK